MPAKNNDTRTLCAFGETLTLAGWSERHGVPVGTIRSRVDRLGWKPEDAVTQAPDKRFQARPAPGASQTRIPPRMKRHANGQAFARWVTKGVEHYRYFGVWGSDEAVQGYARFLADWAAGADVTKPAAPPPVKGGYLLGELAAAYTRHAKSYYRKAGRITSEYNAVRVALRRMLRTVGDAHMPCEAYGPPELRAYMAAMVADGRPRRSVNADAGRVVRMFKWGAVEGHCPLDVPGRLVLVGKIRRGQTAAPEWTKKKPIPWADVEATLPHLYPGHEPRRAVLEALVRTHWLVGCRPTVICRMRPADLDRSGPCWRFDVPDEFNKNAHRDIDLVFHIGPKAQALITPLLAGCPDDRAVFALPPRRKKGDRWITLNKDSYVRLVGAACKRAGVKPWTPHRMRHTRSTEVRRIYESDQAAGAVIGDTPAVAAEIYAERDDRAAIRIAMETG